MHPFWLTLAALIAPVNWYAADRSKRRLVYVTKPAVMLALLISFGSQNIFYAHVPFSTRADWFFLGAVLGLLGDILLMAPRFFNYGLVSFLFGHLAYVVGFAPRPLSNPLTSLIILSLLSALLVIYYPRLRRSMIEKKLGKLRLAVLVYMLVISSMVFSALLTLADPAWPRPAAALAALGAGLFAISDGILAWDRFAKKLRRGRLLVMVTYHLAQLCILLAAALA